MERISILDSDRRGSAIIEFALLLPVLAALLFGMLAYGQYFLLAHSVQQLANDAARATVGGLTRDERAQLATDTVSAELPRLKAMPPARVTTRVEENNGLVTVAVLLDAGNVPLFHLSLVPMPDPMIERRAVIRAGSAS